MEMSVIFFHFLSSKVDRKKGQEIAQIISTKRHSRPFGILLNKVVNCKTQQCALVG